MKSWFSFKRQNTPTPPHMFMAVSILTALCLQINTFILTGKKECGKFPFKYQRKNARYDEIKLPCLSLFYHRVNSIQPWDFHSGYNILLCLLLSVVCWLQDCRKRWDGDNDPSPLPCAPLALCFCSLTFIWRWATHWVTFSQVCRSVSWFPVCEKTID